MWQNLCVIFVSKKITAEVIFALHLNKSCKVESCYQSINVLIVLEIGDGIMLQFVFGERECVCAHVCVCVCVCVVDYVLS